MGISNAAGSVKPKWLWPAVGAAILVLAGAAWFFFGRAPDAAPGGAPVSVLPRQPGTNAPLWATPHTASGGPATNFPSPSGVDPILGCWHWMNNAAVVVNANGTMTAGPFTAQWRLADPARRIYNFAWPEAVDSVSLSQDGGSLSGGNQYGVSMTATRVSPGQDIAGAWRWYNGVIVTILPNGTFSAMTTRGRWQGIARGSYTLTWPGPVDTVTMSPDHRRVSGANQYGFQVSGTKTTACGG